MQDKEKKEFRKESDSLGSVELDKDAYYGSYTARVLQNFQISNRFVPEKFLKNYIGIKRVYAHLNYKHKKLEKNKAEAIVDACDNLLQLEGAEFIRHFPIDIFQSGGGTSTNMAVNEVIANMAEESLGGRSGQYKMIHPNDDVNMSQSSNDTFPAVIKITSYYQSIDLIAELEKLEAEFQKKSKEYRDIKKVGRTHLQDALVMPLGREFEAFSRTVEKNIKYIEGACKLLVELPLGATAIGTRQNISQEIRTEVIKELSDELGIKFSKPQSYFEAISSSSDCAKLSDALGSLSNDLIKICNDLRLLASGPRAGLGEILLPEVQPGSSIMPGKVNPSILEAVEMVAFEVIGNNHTVQIASRNAQLQLQQFTPIIAWNLFDSFQILTNAITTLTQKCVRGIKPNLEFIDKNLMNSLIFATKYAETLGYDKVAELVKEAQKKGLDLKGILEEELMKIEEKVD